MRGSRAVLLHPGGPHRERPRPQAPERVAHVAERLVPETGAGEGVRRNDEEARHGKGVGERGERRALAACARRREGGVAFEHEGGGRRRCGGPRHVHSLASTGATPRKM